MKTTYTSRNILLLTTFSIFVIASVSLYARHHLSEASTDPRAFGGSWANADPRAQGIKIVELKQDQGTLFVHVWGACVPRNCDWGARAANLSDKNVNAQWDLEGMKITLVLALRGDRLRAKATYKYEDGRAQEYETDYFTRQL